MLEGRGTNGSTKHVRQRNPERTRELLLQTAFSEVYRNGFQGTGLDSILAKAHVTKGALYHHFGSKEKLGYAIVDEVITELTRQKWLIPLAEARNPIDILSEIVLGTSLLPDHVMGGCPLNNLSQEMALVDDGFRKRTAEVFRLWIDAVAAALQRGQEQQQVRADIDAQQTATHIAAMYEGYMSLAKNAQDPEVLRSGLITISGYLETLRA